ncbi:DUF4249 domain-containing protein [Cryomorphaceae bacterium]|nr:DUF4249 domain-containing protein [Cryomorphaceae bacterium]
MKKLLFIICLAAFTAGCEKEVPFDPEESRTRIVMYSFLYPGEIIQVELTQSQNILINSWNEDYPPVQNAIVRVYKDGELLGEMQEDQINNNGQYFLFETVEAGAEYRFQVAHSEFEGVQAFTRVPATPPTFTARLIDTTNFEWTLEVEVEDQSGANFYLADFLWEYESGGASLQPMYFSSTDPFLSTPYTYYDPTDPNKYFDGEAYFTDEHFADGTYTFRIKFYADYWTSQSFTGIHVRLKNMSEDYYRYKYSSLLQQWTDGDPFAQPAIVHNNVENGIGCVGSLFPGTVVVDL